MFTKAQSRHLMRDFDCGNLSVLQIKRQNAAESSSPDDAEEEYLLGTVSFMPNRTRRTKNVRIQISIQQKVSPDGFMTSLRPTLSFSAILPNDSEVFLKVKAGDLDGLQRMLADGTATLSDCNERGNSLLTVCPLNHHAFYAIF
jgi:hypothetical protein